MTSPAGKRRGAQGSLDDITRIAAEAGREADVDPTFLGGYLEAAVSAASVGRRLTEAELEACRKLGVLSAERGIALSAAVDLYLSATWRLWRTLEAEGLGRGRRRSVDVEALFRSADDAVAAVAKGFEEAQRRAIRRDEAARREFIDDLFVSHPNAGALLEASARFGFNVAGTHVVVVGRTDRAVVEGGPIQGQVELEVLTRLRGPEAIVTTKDGLLVCVLPATGIDPCKDLLAFARSAHDAHWQMGVGGAHPGPSGVYRSYAEAREALALAEGLDLKAPVVPFETVLPYRVLTRDVGALTQTVDAVFGPLGRGRGGKANLIRTLHAYFAEHGNVSAAARRLHVSPRGVAYRLDRIAKLTGYSVRNAEDRFVLELALKGYRLIGRD